MHEEAIYEIISRAQTAGIDEATAAIDREQQAIDRWLNVLTRAPAAVGAAEAANRRLEETTSRVADNLGTRTVDAAGRARQAISNLAATARSAAASAGAAIQRGIIRTLDIARAAAGRLRGALGALGRAASAGLTALGLAAAAGFGVSIRAAANFEEQLAIINTIALETPAGLSAIGDSIRGLAVRSGQTLPDLTGAFYDLLSAGIQTKDAMTVLDSAVTLSIGGLSTTNEAVDLLTTTLNAWGAATGDARLEISDTARVTDIFAKAIEGGKVTADQIAGSIANVAALAAQMNIKIEEVGAAYAVMTARGIPAAEVTQQMNAALVALLRIPPGMERLQEATGKSYEKIARTQGVQAAMQALIDDANRYGESLIDVFGRQDAMNFALTIAGENADAFRESVQAMYNSTGTAAEQAAQRQETFFRQWAILKQSALDLAIEIGNHLLPGITAFVKTLASGIQTVTAWTRENRELVGSIVRIAAPISAIIGLGAALRGTAGIFDYFGGTFLRLGISLGPIAAAINGILLPITLGVGAFIAFRKAVDNNLGGLGRLSGVMDNVSRAVASGVQILRELVDTALDVFGALAQGDFEAVGDRISRFVSDASRQFTMLVEFASRAAVELVDELIDASPAIIAAATGLAAKIVEFITAAVPLVAEAAGQFALAFLNWIGEIAPTMGFRLGILVREVTDWIRRTAPEITRQLSEWTGALIRWVERDAIPALLTALGGLVDGVVAFVGGGRAIFELSRALTAWVTAFVGWVADATRELLAKLPGMIAAIGAWVVQNAPKIIGAVAVLGGSIVAGIAAGILEDPGVIVDALVVVLGATALLVAVKAAGAVAGAAYAGSMAVAERIGQVIASAWRVVQSAAAGVAGGIAGAAYVAGVRVATVLSAVITAAWTAVVTSAPVVAAVGAAGAAAGAIYRAAFAAAVAAGAFAGSLVAAISSALGVGVAGGGLSALGAAAGGSLMTGLAAGITAAAPFVALTLAAAIPVALVYENQRAGLDEQGRRIALDTAEFVKTATLAQLRGAREAVVSGLNELPLIDFGQRGTLQGVLDVLDAAIANRIAGFGPYEVPSPKIGDPWANVDPDQYKGQLVGPFAAAKTEIVKTFTNGVETVIDIAAATPGQIADAIERGQQDVESGMHSLRTAMENEMTTAQRIAKLKGQLASKELADGLASRDPYVRRKAQAVVAAIESEIAVLEGEAKQWGKDTIQEYIDGMLSKIRAVEIATNTVLNPVRRRLQTGSPPGPESPLHFIDVWGRELMEVYADSIAEGGRTVVQRASDVLRQVGDRFREAEAPGFGVGSVPPASETAFLNSPRFGAERRSGNDARLTVALERLTARNTPLIGTLNIDASGQKDAAAVGHEVRQAISDVMGDVLREEDHRYVGRRIG